MIEYRIAFLLYFTPFQEIFDGANLSRMAKEASKEIFAVVNSHFEMPRNHTHHKACMKYWYVGVSPSFNFHVDCSVLEKCENLYQVKISPLYGNPIHQTRQMSAIIRSESL